MKKISLLTAGILCCAACNNDIEITEEPGQQIQLFIPGAQEVSVYSATTVSECICGCACSRRMAKKDL
jgi:hypothetical protein